MEIRPPSSNRFGSHKAASIGLLGADVLSMSSGCRIHVFVEFYDFTIKYCEHMRKVTAELPTSRFNPPGIMTQSQHFITASDKLSWIKMLNLLSINQAFEELPHLFMTSTFASKWHIL